VGGIGFASLAMTWNMTFGIPKRIRLRFGTKSVRRVSIDRWSPWARKRFVALAVMVTAEVAPNVITSMSLLMSDSTHLTPGDRDRGKTPTSVKHEHPDIRKDYGAEA
jgi:hypothetical protein